MKKSEIIILALLIFIFLSSMGYAVYMTISGDKDMSAAAKSNKAKEDKELQELQEKIDEIKSRSILNN